MRLRWLGREYRRVDGRILRYVGESEDEVLRESKSTVICDEEVAKDYIDMICVICDKEVVKNHIK